VAALRGDDCRNHTGLIYVPSFIGNVPGIVDSPQPELACGFVVIYFFGQDRVCHFEAIGVEGRSRAIIIICDDEVGGELSPNFLVMGAGLCLKQLRDVDVLGPLLLVLLALKALHFYQVCHFNFQNGLPIKLIIEAKGNEEKWDVCEVMKKT
jgi:hypothetical protein